MFIYLKNNDYLLKAVNIKIMPDGYYYLGDRRIYDFGGLTPYIKIGTYEKVADILSGSKELGKYFLKATVLEDQDYSDMGYNLPLGLYYYKGIIANYFPLNYSTIRLTMETSTMKGLGNLEILKSMIIGGIIKPSVLCVKKEKNSHIYVERDSILFTIRKKIFYLRWKLLKFKFSF